MRQDVIKENLEKAFDGAYASLNEAQKQAVDSIEGPVMVIAGPGTGKTQILTLRIANILLKTDTKPENILALTFTESGASAMRERLLKYIGPEAYRVGIFTFHAFAGLLINQYPDAYMRIIGGQTATDLELLKIIETIINEGTIKLLRPTGDPRYYVSAIQHTIESLKREYVTPDGFSGIIAGQEQELLGIEPIHQKGAHKGKPRSEYQKKEKNIAKNRELLYVYRQYEALLRSERLYDYNDMIIETIVALEHNEDMLRDLQEQYQYILADEHQDVNGSQNRILELLTSFHDQPNIFVVGDEKQAIYRFQGASLENFLYFEDSFKGTQSISLTTNYRSGQLILDASFSLIQTNQGPAAALRVALHAHTKETAEVVLHSFSHELFEDAFLVEQVKELHTAGTQADSMTVLVRTNREVEKYASLLRKEGFAVNAVADSDILKHPITRSIEALLFVLVEGNSEEALTTVLHGSYWHIAQSDLFRVLSSRNYDTSLQSIISSESALLKCGVTDPQSVLKVTAVLEKARTLEITQSPQKVLEYVLQESGLLDMVLAEDPVEGGRIVRRLYDEIETMVSRDNMATLRDVKDAFVLRMQYGIPLRAPSVVTSSNAVNIMTVHKSKGLEFEVVFIPHLVDSVWGKTSTRTYFDVPLLKHLNANDIDALDDERRLLYVALTRAKKKVYLSYADTNEEGRSFVPSRLLSEIDPQYMHVAEVASDQSIQLSSLQKREPSFSIEPAFMKQMLLERGLSPTSLNNYLEDPWDYFYSNVLRIPQIQSESMQFGTAVHAVLQRVCAFHTTHKKLPSDTEIKEYLERALGRLPITKEQFVQLLEKGLTVLIPYIHHIEPSLPKETKEEFSIRVHLQTGLPDFPELLLTGKLDRLDIDKEGNVVKVVDYKTGKPKTRNYIEGKTKDATGNYKRQLTFYALLLSLYGDERYACAIGLLSFVEPDSKGAVHEEQFEISTEEIEGLKKELITVAQEIISGEFLKEPCQHDSHFSHLTELLLEHRVI